MQNLFTEVEKELPLTMERETDCRETWPKRWALLKAKVEKFTSANNAMDAMQEIRAVINGLGERNEII